MIAPWIGRPVVYRCYDDAGALLYIGSTLDVERRMHAHQGTSFWRCKVARVRIQLAPDELTARRIEAAAIREENPRFNIMHRRPRIQWSEQDFRDVIRALEARPLVTSSIAARIDSLQRQLQDRLEDLA